MSGTLNATTINATQVTLKSLAISSVAGNFIATTSDVTTGTSFVKVITPASLANVMNSIGPIGVKNPTAGIFQTFSASTISGPVLATGAEVDNTTIQNKGINPSVLQLGFTIPNAIGTVTPAPAVFTNIVAQELGTNAIIPIVSDTIDFSNNSKVITPLSLAAAISKPPTIGATTPNNAAFSTLTVNGTLTLTTPITYAKGGLGQSFYTKGDILLSTGAGYVKLPVGRAGTYLKADSSAIGGVRWATLGNDINVTRQASSLFATNSQSLDFTNSAVALTPGNVPTIFSKPPAIGGATPSDIITTNINVNKTLTLPAPLATTKGGTGMSSIAVGNILAGNGSGLTALSSGSQGQFLQTDPNETTGLIWKTANPVLPTTIPPQLANYSYFSQAPYQGTVASQWIINDSYVVSPLGNFFIQINTPTTINLANTSVLNGLAQSSNLAGTVSVSIDNPYTVVGTSTTFTQDFIVGDTITIGSFSSVITSIINNTTLTVKDYALSVSNTAQWGSLVSGYNTRNDSLANQSKFGKYSLKVDGANYGYNSYTCTNPGLTTPTEWTIELWHYYQNTGSSNVLVTSDISNVFAIGKSNSNTYYYSIGLGVSPGSYNFVNNSTYTPSSTLYNSWVHLALQYSATTGQVKFFINGTQVGSNSTSAGRNIDPQAFAKYRLGGLNGTQGIIDEIRLSNVARYSANFSVPGAAFAVDANTINIQHCENPNLNLSEVMNLTGISSSNYSRGGIPKNGRLLIYIITDGTTPGYFVSSRDTSAGDSLTILPNGYSQNFAILLQYYFEVTNNVVSVTAKPGYNSNYMNAGILKTVNKGACTIPYFFARNSQNSDDICIPSAETIDLSTTLYGQPNGVCFGSLPGYTTSIPTTTTVSGTGTNFTSSLKVGDIITMGNSESRKVTAIASDTQLTVDTAFKTTSAWENYNSGYLVTGDCSKFGNSLYLNTYRPISILGLTRPAGAWTIEFWFMPLRDYGASTGYILSDTLRTRFNLYLNSNNQVNILLSSSVAASGTWDIFNNTSSNSALNRQWNHFALVYDGFSNYSLYLNGLSQMSMSNVNPVHPLVFSSLAVGTNNSTNCNMLLDSFRISNTTRYPVASTIAMPTIDFISDTNTISLNRFESLNNIDTDDISTVQWISAKPTSSSFAKFGSGSVRFYAFNVSELNLAPVTAPSSNWTIECWFYCLDYKFNTSSPMAIWSTNNSSTVGGITGTPFVLYIDNSSGTLRLYLSSDSINANIANNSTGGTVSMNAWSHVALVFNGSSYKVYLNGTAVITVNSSTQVHSDTWKYFTLGNFASKNNTGFEGYIDSLRISNSVRYTSNFTPATSAFSTDSNTLALNNFENGYATDDAGATWTFTNRVCSTLSMSPKFGSAMCAVNSLAFPRIWLGATQYQLFTNWTIEFWYMANSLDQNSYTNTMPVLDSTTQRLQLRIDSAQQAFTYYVNSTWNRGTNKINVAQWMHVAIVFNGSAYTFWINGNLDLTVTTTNNVWGDLNNIILLGSISSNIGSNSCIDSFSLSSIARYSSTFTAPTGVFTADANTLVLNGFDNSTDVFYDVNLLDDTNNTLVVVTDGASTFTYTNAGTSVSSIRSRFGSSSLSLSASSYLTINNVPAPPISKAINSFVTLYHDNYSGTSSSLGIGSYTSSTMGISDNNLTSMKIPQGLSVTLYDNGNFTGSSIAFSSDVYNLSDYGWNDMTSSLRIALASSQIGQWTAECFVYITSFTSNNVVMQGYLNGNTQGMLVQVINGNIKFSLTSQADASSWDIASQVGSTAITVNTWTHIAVVFNGSSYLFFVGGSLVATIVSSVAVHQNLWTSFMLGDAVNSLRGSIDELRISSTARYATTFTPRTTAFLPDDYTVVLNHFDTTNITNSSSSSSATCPTISNTARSLSSLVSTANPKFGSSSLFLASGNFNTAGDSFSISVTEPSGPWTIEFWMCPSNTRGSTIISGTYNNYAQGLSFSQNQTSLSLSLSSIQDQVDLNANIVYTNFGNFYSQNWNCVSIVYTGSGYLVFINGYLQYSTTTATKINSLFWKKITFGGAWTGYMDSIRISNVARYLYGYMPPQQAFTYDQNTLYLNNIGTPEAATKISSAFNASNYGIPSLANPPLNASTNTNAETYTDLNRSAIVSGIAKFGNYSLALNQGYYKINHLPQIVGPWTVEGWVYPQGYSNYNTIFAGFDGANQGFVVMHNNSALTLTVQLYTRAESTFISTATPNTLNLNAWNHIALVYSGSAYSFYINGTQQFNTSSTNVIDPRTWANVCIGYPRLLPQSLAYDSFYGFVDCFRVSNSARYSTAFTPASSVLTFDANTVYLNNFDTPAEIQPLRFLKWTPNDGSSTMSTSQYKYGSASLSIPNQGSTAVSASCAVIPAGTPWTIECWVYFTSRSSTNTLFTGYAYNNAPYQGIMLRTESSSLAPKLYLGSDYYQTWDITNANLSSVSFTASQWNHVALVYTGTQYVLYINGTPGVTVAISTPILKDTWKTLWVSDPNGSNAWNGYIDDFRISNIARYSAAFTPPGQLNWDLNTFVLNAFNGTSQNFSTQALGYAAYSSTDTTVTMSTSQYKYGTSSLYLPGGTSALNLNDIPQNPTTWTIEFDTYMSSKTTGNVLLCGYDGSSYKGLVLQLNGSTSTLVLSLSSHLNEGDIASAIGSTDLSNNTWTHIALVFDGSTYYFFTDGSLSASASSSMPISPGLWSCLQLGTWNSSGTSWNGYIDNLRISNSARYTSTFTPPSAAFAFDSNTLILQTFDGANGTRNFESTARKGSVTAPVFTPSDSSVVMSSQICKFGNASLALPNSNSRLVVSNLKAPAQVWTISMWAYFETQRSNNVLVQGFANSNPQGMRISMNGNLPILSLWSGSGASPDIANGVGSISMLCGSWSFVSVMFNGSQYIFSINGNVSATVTSSVQVYSQLWNCVTLGSPTNSWMGYIDDFRITNYPYSVVPSTNYSPDLYTLALNSFDIPGLTTNFNANNNVNNTNVSPSDGNSRFGSLSLYVSTRSISKYAIPVTGITGQWTIECWATTTSAPATLLCATTCPGGYFGILLQLNTSGIPKLSLGSAYTFDITSASGTIPIIYGWNHYAVVFTGTQYLLFINGNLSTTINSTTPINAATWNYLMLSDTNLQTNYGWNGYIDEIRVSNTARYASVFSPQPTPFVSDTNTLYLQHVDNYIDTTFNPPVKSVVNGSPIFSPAQVNFGYTSLMLQSATDYVSINVAATLSTWTLEFWVYASTFSGTQTLMSGSGFLLNTVSGSVQFNGSGSTALSTGTWTHIAVVYTGTQYRFFVAGTLITTTTAQNTCPWSPLLIGDNTGGSLVGYFDELRISSSARYSATFTPPTAAFTYDSYTVMIHHFDNLDIGFMVPNNEPVIDKRTQITPIASESTSTLPSSLVTWLDASDSSSVTVSGSYISSVTNKSTVGGTATPSTNGSVGVSYTSNIINGLSVFNFAGSGSNNNYLKASASTYTTGYTMIMIIQFKTTFSSESLWATDGNWTTGSNHVIVDSSSNWQYSINGTSDFHTTQNFTTGRPYLVVAQDYGTYANLYCNGALLATTTFNNNTRNFNTIDIGGWSGDLNRTLNGYIGEVQLYSAPLDTSTILSISSFLCTKWGISFNGPVPKFGKSCLSLPIATSALVPAVSPPSAWTMECWFGYPTVTSWQTLLGSIQPFSNTNNGFTLDVSVPYFYLVLGTTQSNGSIVNNQISGSSYLTGGWNHLALVFTGTQYTLYINGSSIYTTTNSNQIYSGIWSSLTLGVGVPINNASSWNGFIDGYRLSNVARYTSNFSVPTSAFTTDSSTLVLNNFDPLSGPFSDPLEQVIYNLSDPTITTTSAVSKFGGSSLITNAGVDLAMPTPTYGNPWTLETWFYPIVTDNNTYIFRPRIGSAIILRTNNSTQLLLSLSSNASTTKDITNDTNTNAVLPLYTWSHIALVYTGTQYVLYLNGTSILTINNSKPVWKYTFQNILLSNGYYDNIRLSTTARYTSNFTVPSAAFSPDTNTLYLSSFNQIYPVNALTESYTASQSSVQTVGNTLFLGSGVHHSSLQISALATPTSWTIECSAYPTSNSGNVLISSTTGVQIGLSAGKIVARLQSVSGSWNIGVIGQTSVRLHAWTHVALVFDGSTYYLFINGNLSESLVSTTAIATSAWSTLSIGSADYNMASWSGFVDNFRVSNAALYTSTFSVPSSFPRGSSTLALNTFDTSLPVLGMDFSAKTSVTTTLMEEYFASSSTISNSSLYPLFGKGSLKIQNGTFSVASFMPPSDAWTIECWSYSLTTPSSQTVLCGFNRAAGTTAGILVKYSGNTLTLTLSSASATLASAVGSVAAPAFAWNHIAIVFTGTTDGNYYFFVNGTLSASLASTTPVSPNTWNSIQLGDTTWNGYFDDFRLSNTALYKANFTTPSALSIDANTIVFNNFNNVSTTPLSYTMLYTNYGSTITTSSAKYGTGSVVFDTTPKYFTISNLPYAPKQWTIEFWAYTCSWVNYRTLFRSSSTYGFVLSVNNAGAISTSISTNNSSWTYTNTTATNSMPLNAWTHFALVYTGNQYLLFSNGSVIATINGVNMYYTSFSQIIFGSDLSGANPFDGYYDDLRISNCARYTAAFTPPSAALSRDANTLILNNFNGIQGSTSISQTEVQLSKTVTYTNPTSAILSMTQRKFGSTSLQLSATNNNYLILNGMPSTPVAWTIEMYVYPNGLANSTILMTTVSGVRLVMGSSGALTLGSTSSGTAWNITVSSSNSIANATWSHIAIVGVQSGSNYVITLYVNGAASGSTSTAVITSTALSNLLIGFDNSSNYWNGYVDELRISNSARYTANFTPQVAPFAIDANTIALNHFELRAVYPTVPSNLNSTDSVLSNTIYRGGAWLGTIYYLYALGSNKRDIYILSTRNVANGDALIDLPSGFNGSSVRQLPYVIITAKTSNTNFIDMGIYDISWSKVSSTQMMGTISQDQYSSVPIFSITSLFNPGSYWTSIVPTNISSYGCIAEVYDNTGGGTTVNISNATGVSTTLTTYGTNNPTYIAQNINAPLSFVSGAVQSNIYLSDTSNGSYVRITPRFFTMTV